MSTLAMLFGALATGALGSPHCVGMCGGFATACAARGGTWATVRYSVGRLITYATLGAVAGTLGTGLASFRYVGTAVSALFLVYFAGRLAGVVPPLGQTRLATWAKTRCGIAGRRNRVAQLIPAKLAGAARRVGGPGADVLFGVSTALLPCGLVYSALALPIFGASAAAGALTMVAFGLGTTPLMWLTSFGGLRLAAISRPLRKLVAVAVLGVGGWMLLERGALVPEANGEPDCCATDAR